MLINHLQSNYTNSIIKQYGNSLQIGSEFGKKMQSTCSYGTKVAESLNSSSQPSNKQKQKRVKTQTQQVCSTTCLTQTMAQAPD